MSNIDISPIALKWAGDKLAPRVIEITKRNDGGFFYGCALLWELADVWQGSEVYDYGHYCTDIFAAHGFDLEHLKTANWNLSYKRAVDFLQCCISQTFDNSLNGFGYNDDTAFTSGVARVLALYGTKSAISVTAKKMLIFDMESTNLEEFVFDVSKYWETQNLLRFLISVCMIQSYPLLYIQGLFDDEPSSAIKRFIEAVYAERLKE